MHLLQVMRQTDSRKCWLHDAVLMLNHTRKIVMKAVILQNRRSNEKFVCDNWRDVRVIEGVEYINVRKLDTQRQFLMRKDALQRVDAPRS